MNTQRDAAGRDEIDEALARRFAPPVDLEARALEFAARLATRSRPRPWPIAAAGLLAAAAGLLALAVLQRRSAKEPAADAPSVPACAVGPLEEISPGGEPPELRRPDLETLYREVIACSRTRVLTCSLEDWRAPRGGVRLKNDAPAIVQGPFSSSEWPTGTIWTSPPDEGAVLVADLDTTHRCCLEIELPPGSGLNLFTWRVDGVVLTEITPLAEPRLLDCFEPAVAR